MECVVGGTLGVMCEHLRETYKVPLGEYHILDSLVWPYARHDCHALRVACAAELVLRYEAAIIGRKYVMDDRHRRWVDRLATGADFERLAIECCLSMFVCLRLSDSIMVWAYGCLRTGSKGLN